MLYILRIHATILKNVQYTTTVKANTNDVSSLLTINVQNIQSIYTVLQRGYSSDPLLIHLPDW